MAALLLAIVVCLVLVMPQVDLDAGVLQDVGSQLLLFMFVGLATALIPLLPPDLSHALREIPFEEIVHLRSMAWSVLSLRC